MISNDTDVGNVQANSQNNGQSNSQDHSLIESLTMSLEKDVLTLTDYLRSQNSMQPSFARDTPAIVVDSHAPEKVQMAREAVMDQALQIFQLASGPSEYLANTIAGYHYMECLRWLSHFKIFDIVPLEGSLPYADVARKANVSEARLKSIARMAMSNRLFSEPSPGQLAHSATSAVLCTNESWKDQRIWMSSVICPTIASMVDAHEKWPASTEPNNTAFNQAFNTDLGMYKYIAQQPSVYKLFGRVMKAVASSPKSDMKHLVSAFDWASLGKAKVVDVGGNIGHSCVTLAKEFPDLSFVVQDTDHVVLEGREHINSMNDENLSERIKFEAHDFFQKQPVRDANVYLLRQIFHNWDLDHSVKILENVVSSMKPGSHALIMEFVLPDPGSVPSVNERVLRSRDLGMMQLFNSCERDLSDWEAIVEKVNPGVKIKAVNTPFGSFMSVIDVVLTN